MMPERIAQEVTALRQIATHWQHKDGTPSQAYYTWSLRGGRRNIGDGTYVSDSLELIRCLGAWLANTAKSNCYIYRLTPPISLEPQRQVSGDLFQRLRGTKFQEYFVWLTAETTQIEEVERITYAHPAQ